MTGKPLQIMRSQRRRRDLIFSFVVQAAARWEVAWHPKALDEKNEIEDVAERVAIAHVIEKLEVDGPALQSPHQSGVMGRRDRA